MRCALFYLLLFYILTSPILSPLFSDFRFWFFWFCIFGKTSFNTLRFIKYIKYWYGLPLRMSYIMRIRKRYPYYLFSGHSVSFSFRAFMRYYKIEMVPQRYADLSFYLDPDFLLNPLWFSTIFFYNPLIFDLYFRFYFLFWFYTLVFLILSPWILTLRRRVTKMAGLSPWQFIRKNTSTNKHYIQNENVLFNPWNPDSKLFTGNNRKKQTCPPIYIRHPQGLPLLGTQSSLEIMRAAASCLNHGFRGFQDFTV